MTAPTFLAMLLLTLAAPAFQDAPPVRARRIWGEPGAHCAFPDLIPAGDRLLVVFREGERHVHGRDGVVRVIASDDDGENWSSVASLAVPGLDLRDPKLARTPDGRVCVTMGGSRYVDRQLVERLPHVAFADDEGRAPFGPPRPIAFEPEGAGREAWLWRVTWHEAVGYGVTYRALDDDWGFDLFETRDGATYRHVTALDVDGRPGETTLRFAPDGTAFAVVRREGGDRRGRIGRSAPPYSEWVWSDLPVRLGGPDLLLLPDGSLLVGTRRYPEDSGEGTGTVLARWTADGVYTPFVELPSGGDTSYPRMLREGARLTVVYYSSHGESTAIWLARVALPAEWLRER